MRSRILATQVVLPAAMLVILVLVAACSPLPSVVAPDARTAVPGSAQVSPIVTPLSPDVTAPAPPDSLPPTVSAALTTSTVVTVPGNPTAAAELPPATPDLGVTPPATPAQLAEGSSFEWVSLTYVDEFGGWQIDYPESWSVTDVAPQIRQQSVGYSVTFASWKPGEPGTQGIPEGGSKVDIGVNKDAADSLEAAVESRRAELGAGDPGSAITFEEPWDLPGGLTGTHWTIQTSRGETVHELVTAIEGNLVLVSGLGDGSLFEQIASTLRPVDAEARAEKELLVPMVTAGGTEDTQARAQERNLALTVYTVKAGDTLAKIAARFRVTVSAILGANPQVTNPDRIYIGQRLNVPVPGGSATPRPPSGATRVNIYMIGEGGGNVGCGDEAVAVRRDVPRTAAPLTAALNLLLSQKGQFYGESGLRNALYQSDLRVASITRVGSAWTINLVGTLRLGGVCDSPRVKAQLEQTALQFATVKSVRYFVNGKALETLLSGN